MLLATALVLAPALLVQTDAPTTTNEAAERRRAVEQSLTPRPHVEGIGLGMLERMRQLDVPGVSVAVLHEGRIDWAAGYGLRDAATGDAVTTETLFQAASISKPVSGLLVMRLAQEGLVDPEAPVNELLTSWQLPDDGFEGDVTPAHIMSHTGGLGVHGFPGYRAADPLPSAVGVLDGAEGANTSPVRRIEPLGRGMRYSGGGSTVLQLAVCDATGRDYTGLIAEQLLGPLGMTRSTFAQPLPVETWPDHSAAHGEDGRVIAGRFHAYPEQYAAGLWTTPADLLRIAQEVQRGLAGEDGRVLEAETVERMLAPRSNATSLGWFLREFEGERWFEHGGSNAGFRCQLFASFEGGRGVAVMTNADNGSQLADEIVRGVARVYGWPGFVEEPLAVGEPSVEAAKVTIRYAFGPDDVVYVAEEKGELTLRYLPQRARRLVPLERGRFLVLGSRVEVSFPSVAGRATLALHTNGTRVAQPMDEFERWPVEDLVEGEVGYGLEFYREVLADNPEDPLVAPERMRGQAQEHWNVGELDAALGLVALAVEADPSDPFGWELLGRMQASLDEVEAATASFEACLAATAEADGLSGGDRGWLERNARSMLRLLRR